MTARENVDIALLIELAVAAAFEVFVPERDPWVGAAIGKPEPPGLSESPPMGVHDLLAYVQVKTGRDMWPYAFQVAGLISEMVRAGLLMEHPRVAPHPMIFARAYWAIGRITSSQAPGDLWLAEVLGAGLIIPSFGSVTIPTTGEPKFTDAEHTVGSGLVLDLHHILTAGHVVDDMTIDDVLSMPTMCPPRIAATAPRTVRVNGFRRSESVDLAVIEVEPDSDENGLKTLAGVSFRDPEWGDTTYVFGYPPSQIPDAEHGPNLIVQRGDVVNPTVRGYRREELFLYSAIARPGASGGPIVAQDGRVIGMVVEDGYSAADSLGANLKSATSNGFYLGLTSGQIERALRPMGLGHLVTMETWT